MTSTSKTPAIEGKLAVAWAKAKVTLSGEMSELNFRTFVERGSPGYEAGKVLVVWPEWLIVQASLKGQCARALEAALRRA